MTIDLKSTETILAVTTVVLIITTVYFYFKSKSPRTISESEQQSIHIVLQRIISIFVVVVYATIFVVLGVIVIFFIIFLKSSSEGSLTIIPASIGIVGKLGPNISQALTSIVTAGATALVLIIVIVGLKWLLTSQSIKLDLSQVLSDSSTFLTLIVFSIIGLLLILSIPIPPVLLGIAVMIVLFAGLKWLLTSQSIKLDLSRPLSDLPSILALIVIISISLLPLLGYEIPQTLRDIALIIVGFYFGKANKEKSDTLNSTTQPEG